MEHFEQDCFEKELAEALGRVMPPAGFANRVQERVQRAGQRVEQRGSGGWWPGWGRPLAAAMAVVVLVAGGTWSYQVRERHRGELARDRTLAALRLTSEKLQLAKSRIHRVSQVHRESEGVQQ